MRARREGGRWVGSSRGAVSGAHAGAPRSLTGGPLDPGGDAVDPPAARVPQADLEAAAVRDGGLPRGACREGGGRGSSDGWVGGWVPIQGAPTNTRRTDLTLTPMRDSPQHRSVLKLSFPLPPCPALPRPAPPRPAPPLPHSVAPAPAAPSGSVMLQVPNSSRCIAWPCQLLKSPMSSASAAPGAHSRYTVQPCSEQGGEGGS